MNGGVLDLVEAFSFISHAPYACITILANCNNNIIGSLISLLATHVCTVETLPLKLELVMNCHSS